MSAPEGAERALDSDTDYGNIRKTFATRDLPRHLALFYRSQSEQFTVASAFVADGLARDERCLYLADQNDPRDVREAFERHRIDVDGRKADGQLDIVDAAQVYTDGAFDPSAAVAQLETRARGSIEEGYTGFRVAGENTWSFDVEAAFESVIHFEIRFDDTCTGLPVTALCQYDVEKFDDAVLGKVLQTHERIIYGDQLTSNPYYVSPEEYRHSGVPKTNVELLLEQTRDITRFKREVELREQRLSVINRILRHNIRNELNVVLGRTEWLRAQDHVAEEGHVHLGTIETVTQRLLDLSERARYVDRTLDSQFDYERQPLDIVIASAVETAEREHDVSIKLAEDLSEEFLVDAALETALDELLSLVGEQELSDPPTLAARRASGSGLVTISLRGRDILLEPAVAAIDSGSEEGLRHSLGLRIWIVRWIIESMNGTVSVQDPVSHETVLELAVPVVGSQDAG